MAVRDEILEELTRDYKNPEDLLGKKGIIKQLYKGFLEKAMQDELKHHLGYEKNGQSDGTNYRNGKSCKNVKKQNRRIRDQCPTRSQWQFCTPNHPKA